VWQTKKDLDVATTVSSTDSASASMSQVVAGQLTQVSIPQAFHTTSKQAADAAVARCFYMYACGIPFVVADSPYFKDAISSVIKCGAGYKLPSRFW